MKYKTIYIDPPWNEQGGGKIKRGADRHYDIVKTEKMPEIIKNCGHWNIEDNAHLYMWVTNNFLEDGLWLMKELNFRYITNLVWFKEKMGIGQYFRGKHELLLFGVRGKGLDTSVCSEHRDISSAYALGHEKENGKIKHSKKPHYFYELIEKRSHGPYLEIFARNNRENWTSFGNEI